MRQGVLGALILGAAAAAPADAQELPTWMAGCWEMRAEGDLGDRWTDECWMNPRGGVMLGASRSGRGATLSGWEATQIMIAPAEAREGAVPVMQFWASPNGAPRSAFTYEPNDLPGVTFVNAEHDYPQRIRYWRDGDLLRAEISLADGSNPMRWTFVRAGGE